MIVGVLPKLQFMDLDGIWMVVPNPSAVQPKPRSGVCPPPPPAMVWSGRGGKWPGRLGGVLLWAARVMERAKILHKPSSQNPITWGVFLFSLTLTCTAQT